jgi:hypothetical protein
MGANTLLANAELAKYLAQKVVRQQLSSNLSELILS